MGSEMCIRDRSYAVLNFNQDGKVIEATEYGSYNSVLETFE